MNAHLLALNEFNKPRVIQAADAGYMHIIYIMLLNPGTFQSHPEMGVGIRERYRDNNDIDMLTKLRQDLKRNVERYLPELTLLEVSLSVRNEVLGIVINTTEGAYVLAYNSTTEQITPAATYILDDL